MRSLAPKGSKVGRLGGDEFAMLIPAAALADAATLLEHILESARAPFVYDGIELKVSASVGVSTFPHCGDVPRQEQWAQRLPLFVDQQYPCTG